MKWRRDWRYFKYVVRHKFWVGYWGVRLGVPIRALLVHDASKFGAAEWDAYATWFYDGPDARTTWQMVADAKRAGRPGGVVLATMEAYNDAKLEFAAAWQHHWQNNRHHWEHHAYTWSVSPPYDIYGIPVPPPMLNNDRLEMLADWLATGMGLKGHGVKEAPLETQRYFADNRHRIRLAPETRFWVEQTLADMVKWE